MTTDVGREPDRLGTMSDKEHNRGVAIEKLINEIETLRAVAIRYANAVAEGSEAASGVGLDLEMTAIRYVRKLDEELQKAKRPDYRAIAEQAARDRETSGN